MSEAERPDLTQFLIGVTVAALAYASFYQLNSWLFSQTAVSEHISWVFLPAAVRMLSVLLFGWGGVVGLFLGSVAVIQPILEADPSRALTLATLSSLPSSLAARTVQVVLSLPRTLAGVTGRQLLLFGLVGGLANSASHTVYFIWLAGELGPLEGFIPMFVGDTVGTLILLYAGALVLRLVVGRSAAR